MSAWSSAVCDTAIWGTEAYSVDQPHADADCFDDSGLPASTDRDEVNSPDVGNPDADALKPAGDGLAPACRDGDRVVMSPKASAPW